MEIVVDQAARQTWLTIAGISGCILIVQISRYLATAFSIKKTRKMACNVAGGIPITIVATALAYAQRCKNGGLAPFEKKCFAICVLAHLFFAIDLAKQPRLYYGFYFPVIPLGGLIG